MAVIGPFTAQDIINDAAEVLGVIGPAGMTNKNDAFSCLRSLNLLLAFWSGEEISARAFVTETFSITGGQRSYLWGAGAPDFNSQRPMSVITAGLQYVLNNNLIIPMEVIGSGQYQSLGDRLIVSGPPQMVFSNETYPYAEMDFYPIPDQGYSVIFTSVKDLAGMINLNIPFSLDSIYYMPMVYNLACMIAPKFGKKVGLVSDPKSIAGIAAAGYASLSKVTSPDMFFTSDYPLSRSGLNAPILDGGYAG